MNETHATKYLLGLPRQAPSGTVERTRRLLFEVCEIPKSMHFIKILGEAGKSSASSLLAATLVHAKIRIGTVSLVPADEPRLALGVDGVPLSHEDFAKAVTAAWAAARALSIADPSYEEILLCAALFHFVREGCRLTLVTLSRESRLSAASALPAPKLCLMTTSSERVAQELLPLIDTTDDLVSAPQEPSVLRLLTERASEMRCRLSFPTKQDLGETQTQNGRLCFSYRAHPLSLPTSAHYQRDNALAALEACHALKRQGLRLREEDAAYALATLNAPLCFRVFSLSPLWLIDAADSPLRLRAFADALARLPELAAPPFLVWSTPALAATVRETFGDRLLCVEEHEIKELRSALKRTDLPQDTPLLIVGPKPFAAEALRALTAKFM